tara:strand:- start:1312 stop:3534 length:2223 start_codon:yes stop_codon:yes gene_type:complete
VHFCILDLFRFLKSFEWFIVLVKGMARRGILFSLVLLLLVSVTSSSVFAQTQADTQPSSENQTMYVWGDQSLSNGQCTTHFSSEGSTDVGYGEFDETENIDFACSLDQPLLQDMYLDPDDSINLQLGFWIQSSENSGGDELLLSLQKDSEILAQQEFTFSTYSNEQISWQIQISENMTFWEEGSIPQLNIQFNKPGPTALECLNPQKALAGCDAKFRLYYSDNMDGLNVEAMFPILNASDPAAVNPNDSLNDNDTVAMAVGSGSLSSVLFSPWFLGMFAFVGFVTMQRDRFQLSMVLEDESEDVVSGDSSSDGETLVDSYRARVLTLCALYVAQGIPWGFITIAFLTFLADKGVGAGELALMLTLGTLPWSVKFLWGPVIDRFQIPSLGRRRPWILLAQSGMILVLASMMLVPNPEENVRTIAWMFLVYNIFTSLQDVSTDALAVDVLKPHEMEKVNSYMFTAKSVGGIIGGAGLGLVIGTLGIKATILLQIPILVLIMLVPLYMTERPGEKRFPWSEGQVGELNHEQQRDFKDILSKLKTAFSLRSARLGIVLSLVMSLSFFLIPVLPLLFVRELGWTVEQFNVTNGGVILLFTILGYLVGGQFGRRFGGKSVIIYGALFTAVVTSLWGLTESLWSSGSYMMVMWSVRTFTWGLVTINIYSLVMRVTWSEVGGTQFTAYMAMMNVSSIIGYQLTEPLASRFDYSTLFLLAAVFETLIIFGALFIDPGETRRTLAQESSV